MTVIFIPQSAKQSAKKITNNQALFWAVCLVLTFVVLAGCVWFGLALWFHRPMGDLLSFLAISGFWLNALILLAFFGAKLPFKPFLITYVLMLLVAAMWFMSLRPNAERQWQDDVAQVFWYDKNGQHITLHNVRNFAWRTEQNYDINWQTRTYDLSKLNRADLIISDWGLNKIVHTMVSFGFDDGQYLTFSIETRKEKTEQYSSLAGFFKKYELLFVAGDEKDLIYTRSNVRGEQVYIYPITAKSSDLQELFLTYLDVGQSLQNAPKWYHTLFSNCTTVIYQLIDGIAPNALPKDYRILLAGELPSYLLEYQLLDNRHSPSEWKTLSHLNPRVRLMNIGTPSATFSHAIRQYDKQDLVDE